jgi:hypothetical protein
MDLAFIKDSSWFRFTYRHWLTVAFFLGFVTDFLLLNQIDNSFDNAILLTYVILATLSLLLFYVGIAEKAPERTVYYLSRYMPLLMQYSFGGLLSGMLIFYGRSGDFFASAPFFLLIIAVIVANELIKKRSERLLYNILVYFTGIFSYLVLIVPVVLKEMGELIFFASGVLALLVMALLLKALSVIIPHFLVLEKRAIIFLIGSFYMLFNTFYFFNIIPPIPLSLTELSIYHNVEKTLQGGYRLTKETAGWLDKLPFLPVTFHPVPGGAAYCFARVYAPTDMVATIVHRWEYYEEDNGWVTRFTLPYQISGSNKSGYRGFTRLANLEDGKWRCGVETERGQVLGREVFTVDSSKRPQNLVTGRE